jgi:hypothetical protein
MSTTLKQAEQMVRQLIAETNAAQPAASWHYQLTSDVDNIDVMSADDAHTLRVHPCWLRFVVAQGDFDSCVAGEINSFYLLASLTAA